MDRLMLWHPNGPEAEAPDAEKGGGETRRPQTGDAPPGLPDGFMLSPESDGTVTIIFRAEGKRVLALPNVPAPEGLAALHEDVERHFYVYYAHARTLYDEMTRLQDLIRRALGTNGGGMQE